MKRISIFHIICLFFVWQTTEAVPYKLIHAFKGGVNDGRTPTFSSLTASGNILYGVTLDGGKFSDGVVFQINADGSGEQIIHTFDGDSVLNMTGSKDDGAYPIGTPVLDGSTLYGMTEEGGSNGFLGGTVYAVNTDHSGFHLLHHFGGLGDGVEPQGSLILSGTTLYGMTQGGGGRIQDDEGIVFSIQTDGSGYTILHSFEVPGQGNPTGSLILWGDTLYGMTEGSVFRMDSTGSNFLVVHPFTSTATDGGIAHGSLLRQGAYLYGMTSQGGASDLGTIFQLYLIGSQFTLLHSFSLDEAHGPMGDLAISGSTLYGMSPEGFTNSHGGLLGLGSVFQIQTNGQGYQLMHTFASQVGVNDGAIPDGSPIILGSELIGMTSAGATPSTVGGTIFALTLPANSGGGGGGGGSGPPTISTTSPLPNGKVGTAYHEQLAATGGTSPYTFSVSAGHLPPGLTLSAAGVLGGKPTKGEIADFTVKVTGHDKETSSQPFSLTVEAPPTLVITAPKPAAKITTPTFTVTGTAADPVGGVAGVFYQLNGGAWTPAQSANGYANWTIPNLPLPADADILSAYAVDTFGNASKTNTVKFTYYVTGPLVVEVQPVGSGSFAPPDNGKSFQIGATFPITAKAAKGFAFVNWTDGNGTVLGKLPGLKFVMSSNLMLIANFVASAHHEMAPNFAVPTTPFQEAAGNYSGLFTPSGDSLENSNSGAVRLTLSGSGMFSGKLMIGANSLPFTGSFDASGKATVSISGNVVCADCPVARSSIPPWQIVVARKKVGMTATLQLDFAHQSVSGELTDGAFVSQVLARRGAFSSANPAQDYKGTYPVVIRGVSGSLTASPAKGTVVVDEAGNVTFTAILPDGSSASQTSLISRNGYFPVYTALPGVSDSGNGSLWAWLQIENGTVRSLSNATALITSGNKLPVQINSAARDATNQN